MPELLKPSQHLFPVEVPWMISPSTPYLRLSSSESASDRPTQVRFLAYFALEDPARNRGPRQQIGFKDARTLYPPYDSNVKLGPGEGPSQLVRINFERGIWSRMYPSHSDRDVLDPALYDFSFLPCPYEPNQNTSEWLKRFHDQWFTSLQCPDPRMYEVRNSSWVRDLRIENRGFNHYVLLGHDAYAEVLAKGWKWESEGSLRGHQ